MHPISKLKKGDALVRVRRPGASTATDGGAASGGGTASIVLRSPAVADVLPGSVAADWPVCDWSNRNMWQ